MRRRRARSRARPAWSIRATTTVSGFVFKVQANMDPNHRDRIAFMRLCSGKLRRGMKLTQVRTGKALTVHSPVLFFGQERQIADDAVAGDVVGIPNHGALRVGDTLAEDSTIRFTGLPSFAPEVLRRVLHGDSEQGEAGAPGAEDLAEEGLVQVFRPLMGGHWIVGVVGILQLDVLKSRVAGEYGAEIELEPVPYQIGALGRREGRQGGGRDVQAPRTAAASRRTATAGLSSSPATPGTSTTSPSVIPASPSATPANWPAKIAKTLAQFNQEITDRSRTIGDTLERCMAENPASAKELPQRNRGTAIISGRTEIDCTIRDLSSTRRAAELS